MSNLIITHVELFIATGRGKSYRFDRSTVRFEWNLISVQFAYLITRLILFTS